MKKMIKGLIAIVFCIVLLSGCHSKSAPTRSYVILNIADNIADTVTAHHYYIYLSPKTGCGSVSFYDYSINSNEAIAVYTFHADFPIIIKEIR